MAAFIDAGDLLAGADRLPDQLVDRARPIARLSVVLAAHVEPTSACRRGSPRSRAPASGWRVAHRLDVVAVGIEHEGAVIVRVIVRSQPRRAVVLAARRERRTIEGVDGGAVLGGESDVQAAFEHAAAADPEIRLARVAEARVGVAAGFLWRHLHHHAIAERRQRTLVECFGAGEVGYAEADMVEHVRLLAAAPAARA